MSSIISSVAKNIAALPYTSYVIKRLSPPHVIEPDSTDDESPRLHAFDESESSPDTDETSSNKSQFDPEGDISLNPHSIRQILLESDDELRKTLPKCDAELNELCTVVAMQLKARQWYKDGVYGDVDGAAPLFSRASEHFAEFRKANQERYAEVVKENLPKLILGQQSQLRALKTLLDPIIIELFSGDYGAFKSNICPLFAGEVPHEEFVKAVYDAINKEENSQIKREITQLLDELTKEIDPDNEEQCAEWLERASSLPGLVSSLLTPEEKEGVVRVIGRIGEEELHEVSSFIKEGLNGIPGANLILPLKLLSSFDEKQISAFLTQGKLPDGLLDKFLELASKDPATALLLASKGYQFTPINSDVSSGVAGVLSNLATGVLEDSTVSGFLASLGLDAEAVKESMTGKKSTDSKTDAVRKQKTENSNDGKGWGSGFGKVVIGLGGAVLALGGYLFSENKFKSSLFGIGALGIGGALASAFKPIRELVGFAKSNVTSAKGWANDSGKWIAGLGSAVLALLGFYVNEEKVKPSVIAVGALGIGAVLASAFGPVRTLFGFPDGEPSSSEKNGKPNSSTKPAEASV